MGSRYYLTGAQLGMLLAFLQCNKIQDATKLLQEIEEKQWIGKARDIVTLP